MCLCDNRCEYVFSGIKYPTVTLNFLKLLPCCFQSPTESECTSSACIYHHSSSAVRRTAPHYCHWGQLFKLFLCFILEHICNTAPFKSSAATTELSEQGMFLIPKNLIPTCQGSSHTQPPNDSQWVCHSLSIWAPVVPERWNPSHSIPDCWVCWANRALRDGLLFLLTTEIITGSNSSFLHLHINPPRPEMPLHSGN